LTGKTEVIGLSDLMTLFIDLGCLCCKQTQRALNVFKNTLNWLKIDSVDQSHSNFNWLECGIFSQGVVTPGTERDIAFSQLAVKGLKKDQQSRVLLSCLSCMPRSHPSNQQIRESKDVRISWQQLMGLLCLGPRWLTATQPLNLDSE
jgi:hypothetical protein